MASFGKRFGKKKANKISKMPRMTQIVGQNGVGVDSSTMRRKKRAKENVNEM